MHRQHYGTRIFADEHGSKFIDKIYTIRTGKIRFATDTHEPTRTEKLCSFNTFIFGRRPPLPAVVCVRLCGSVAIYSFTFTFSLQANLLIQDRIYRIRTEKIRLATDTHELTQTVKT